MSRPAALVLSALTLLSASCASYRCADSETLVRYVPKEDVLLILEIENGIQSESTGAVPVQQAVDALRGAAGGRRKYPASGGLISADFDSPEEADSMEPERAAAFREFADAVHVDERGLFLDERGRLSFFRLTRLEHCGRLLQIVSDWINREAIGPDEESRPFTPEFPFFDEDSWKLMRAAVASGHRWLGVEDDALVLDIPMTEANAARCLAWIVAESRNSPNAAALQVFEQASSLEVTAGHARLRFGGARKPVVRILDRSPDADYDDAVRRRLAELGVELEGPDAPARARARIEDAEVPRPK